MDGSDWDFAKLIQARSQWNFVRQQVVSNFDYTRAQIRSFAFYYSTMEDNSLLIYKDGIPEHPVAALEYIETIRPPMIRFGSCASGELITFESIPLQIRNGSVLLPDGFGVRDFSDWMIDFMRDGKFLTA